jgi:hypothetical protein
VGSGRTCPCTRRALVKLLSRPWFTRVWVVQEFLAKENPKLVCGDRSFAFHKLQIALEIARSRGHSVPVPTASILEQRSVYKAANSKPSLLADLTRFRYFNASDPRDKIYALTGICSDNLENASAPSYKRSIAAVYTEWAVFMVKKYKNLQILQYCRSDNPPEYGLPLQVPNWNQTPYIDLLCDLGNAQVQCHGRNRLLWATGSLLFKVLNVV